LSDLTLRTFSKPLGLHERARMLEDPAWSPPHVVDVLHSAGRPASLVAFDGLMQEFGRRRDRGGWGTDQSSSDRWLAPRVHWALRLTRAQAAERATWLWLAIRYADYIEWRWGGDGQVAENRWYGSVHKQAFARLWWGGELFRDGADYRPVERAFFRQDLTNSYLHRPFVRCRPLAQGLLDVAAPAGRESAVSADDINDLARTVNLATAGSPPEIETGYVLDDVDAYVKWLGVDAPTEPDWEVVPAGPPCSDTTPASLEDARTIAGRCLGYTHAAAEARGARSAERRARKEAKAGA